MSQTNYIIWSEAGDGINGRTMLLEEAKSSVAHHYGDGDWEEVAPADPGEKILNAWEYFTEEGADSVARIEPVSA